MSEVKHEEFPDNRDKIKCDINHQHSAKDSNVSLPGIQCDHVYYKGCLREYLNQNIENISTISQVVCPVEGCEKYIDRMIIMQNFQDFIDKFDDECAQKINKE